MSEKKRINISPKAENIVKGIFTILFATSLGLNAGKVMRTLVFPLIYFFGAFYYVILGIAILHGFYRLFVGHHLRLKSFVSKAGFIILLIGVYFLFGFMLMSINQFDYSVGIQDLVVSYNDQLKDYYLERFINPFNGLWTNGLIGVSIGGLIGSNVIVLVVGIIVSFIGAALFLTRPIIVIVNYISHRSEENTVKRRQNREVRYESKEHAKEAKREARMQAKEDARKIRLLRKQREAIVEEPEEEIPDIEPLPMEEVEEEKEFVPQYGFEPEDGSFEGESSGFERNGISLDNSFLSRSVDVGFSEFTPLSFSGENNYSPNRPNQEFRPESYIEETHKEEIPVSKPVEEVIEDNDEYEDNPLMEEEEEIAEEVRPQINEDLVSIRPTFVDPTPKENPVYNEPAPTPVVEKKKKERVVWVAPSSELLDVYETQEAQELNSKVAEERMLAINQILSDYKVGARCTSYTIGSSVTRFNIEYDPTVSVKQLEKYVGDISRRLNGVNARFTPIVPGEVYSGLEIPNATITTVGFKEVFEALPDVKKHPLAVGFGKNISGEVIAADFDEFPHLLVAGTTGSGKSIYIHSIIATLIMRVSPDDLKIVLVDPKKVEMTKYRDMPHLLCPIITEASKAKVMLSKLVDEMNNRYELFAIADSCSNIKQYNEWVKDHPDHDLMPYIIVVLDEYADLVDTCKEISQPVVSIAQKARAAGIHMLISTQRPSTNVITGVIKGNLPTHVALMTSSYTDSMTILGEGGAEKLLGKGDMLVQSPLVSRVGLTRLQGCYIQNREIGRVVGYLKEHYETVYDENYLDLVDHAKEQGMVKVASGEVEKEADEAEEAKYQSIKEWVMTQQFVSMSKIQRECGVGFNRAGRFFNRLQKEGIVSTQQDGSTKGCKVLVHDEDDYGDFMVTSDELID